MPTKFYTWLKRSMLLLPIAVLMLTSTATAQCEWVNNAPWIVAPATKMYEYQFPQSSVYISRCSTDKAVVNFDNSSTYPATSDTNNYNYFGDTKVCKANAGSKIDLGIVLGYLNGVTATSIVRVSLSVDWNHNGFFEESPTGYTEIVTFSAATSPALPNGIITNTNNAKFTFTVPTFAKNGPTRMRVRVQASGTAPNIIAGGNSACLQARHGEVEDYVMDIVNPCLPPSVISVSNITCNSADICWANVDNADVFDYWVDTCVYPGCGTNPPTTGPWGLPLNPTTCKGLPNNAYSTILPETKYYVTVMAICDTIKKLGMWSAWQKSAWVTDSFTTLPCCNNPQNVKVTEVKSTTARASWDAVHTAHKYEYAVNTTPNNPPSSGTKILGTTIELQGLTHSKTYYFCVRALCSPTPLSGWECSPFATENTTSISSLNVGVPELNAYPNPVRSTVTVTVDNFNKAGMLYVTDITGKVVHSMNMTSSTTDIDMSSFTQGLYLIKYASDNGSHVIKITKE